MSNEVLSSTISALFKLWAKKILIEYESESERILEVLRLLSLVILECTTTFSGAWGFIAWLVLVRHSKDILLRIYGHNLFCVSRRPPPHGRRRSCASASNPRPQPSILSETLSRYSASVCESARRLAHPSHIH
jgi:hypothetical protein